MSRPLASRDEGSVRRASCADLTPSRAGGNGCHPQSTRYLSRDSRCPGRQSADCTSCRCRCPTSGRTPSRAERKPLRTCQRTKTERSLRGRTSPRPHDLMAVHRRRIRARRFAALLSSRFCEGHRPRRTYPEARNVGCRSIHCAYQLPPRNAWNTHPFPVAPSVCRLLQQHRLPDAQRLSAPARSRSP
jgi:hypothetical protein